MRQTIVHTIVIFGLLYTFALQAQPTKCWADLYIHPQYGYGFLMSHKSYTKHMMTSHFTSQEIAVGKPLKTDKPWTKLYNAPEIGLVYWYSNMGTTKYISNVHGIYPYVLFPLNHRKIKQSIRTGVGIGYINDPFDAKNNYKNTMIGSHLNICGALSYEIKLPIKRIALTTSLGLTHFSNGAIKKPNLGINIPTASIGLKFNHKKNKPFAKDSTKQNTDRSLYISAKTGVSDLTIASKKVYPYWSVTCGKYVPIANKSTIELGTDLFYNTTHKIRLAEEGDTVSNSFALIRPAIHGSYVLVFPKVKFFIQAGVYLYSRYPDDGLIFNRLQWHVQLSDKLLFVFGLKTHFAQAETVECGIGYTF